MTEIISKTAVGPAPKGVAKVCRAFNQLAEQSGDPNRVTCSEIRRPSGRVNHHVVLRTVNGRKHELSLAQIDEPSVRVAIAALVERSGAILAFPWNVAKAPQPTLQSTSSTPEVHVSAQGPVFVDASASHGAPSERE